ncbi:Ger(x)C family spore germination protein [Ureibacillus acetophenoni]
MKRCHLILFIFSLLFISACSFKEIEKSAFIAGIGIDPTGNEEKPYKITLKIYNPTGTIKDNPKPNYTYISEDGKSITDAIRLLETKVDKRLEFGHLKLIIIGEKSIKEQSINEMLDFLARRPDIQQISWVMVARPSAESVIKIVPSTETAAYPSLYNYFDHNANESPFIVTTYLFDLKRKYYEKGIDPILPIIEIEDEQFKINKAIVLGDEDKQLELNPQDTKIFNVLKNKVIKADLIVERENENFTIELDRFNINYDAVLNPDGSITLLLELNVTGIIVESKNELAIEKLHEYNKLAEAASKEHLKQFLTKLTGEGFDPIGFGLRFNGTQLHNKLMKYEEWKKLYKDANIDIKINVDLKSTGQLG